MAEGFSPVLGPLRAGFLPAQATLQVDLLCAYVFARIRGELFGPERVLWPGRLATLVGLSRVRAILLRENGQNHDGSQYGQQPNQLRLVGLLRAHVQVASPQSNGYPYLKQESYQQN